MLSEKNVTLIGSNAIFLGLIALLFAFPSWTPALYPAFLGVFLWTDFRRDEELQGLFLFMVAAAGFVLASRAPETGTRIALWVETAGVASAGLGLGFHRRRLARDRHKALEQLQELDSQIRDLERDLKSYQGFEENSSAQIRVRRDLTEAARSLGSTLDPQEVQLRLVHALEKRYPESRIKVLPGQPSDPLVLRAVENRGSVLVKDSRLEAGGGGGFRSAVVAPLLVLKRPFGFVRLEDDRPGVFQPSDQRTVDLYAMLARLALENIQLIQSVNDLATHDPLTQLYTHRAFQDRLQEEVLRAGRSHQPLAIIMCDVDHFKRYNDTYGHPAGDFLLKTIAGILTFQARPVDFVARYGGEEFAILLPAVERAPAVEFAGQIRARVAQEAFVFQGHRTSVTMSFGVACFPQDTTTPSQVLRVADERLYQAKRGGRNQVVG